MWAAWIQAAWVRVVWVVLPPAGWGRTLFLHIHNFCKCIPWSRPWQCHCQRRDIGSWCANHNRCIPANAACHHEANLSRNCEKKRNAYGRRHYRWRHILRYNYGAEDQTSRDSWYKCSNDYPHQSPFFRAYVLHPGHASLSSGDIRRLAHDFYPTSRFCYLPDRKSLRYILCRT